MLSKLTHSALHAAALERIFWAIGRKQKAESTRALLQVQPTSRVGSSSQLSTEAPALNLLAAHIQACLTHLLCLPVLQTEKYSPYEEDIRVPLYVRGPDVPWGLKLPHLIANIDFMPTWLDLAGRQACWAAPCCGCTVLRLHCAAVLCAKLSRGCGCAMLAA